MAAPEHATQLESHFKQLEPLVNQPSAVQASQVFSEPTVFKNLPTGQVTQLVIVPVQVLQVVSQTQIPPLSTIEPKQAVHWLLADPEQVLQVL